MENRYGKGGGGGCGGVQYDPENLVLYKIFNIFV